VSEAKPDALVPAKKKKKKSSAAMQQELRDLARPAEGTPERPPLDMRKFALRVGLILAVIWRGWPRTGA
jgi:hypothetical protein